MKIVNLDMVLLSSPYRTPDRLRSYGVVVVETEDGRTGVGEPYVAVNLPTVCKECVSVLKPLFLGKDAQEHLDVMAYAQDLAEYFDHRGMVNCVLGAVDWALHDLAAQRSNLPLHRYLNAHSKASVELYASTGLVTLSIPELHDELERRISEGYQSIKIRVGCGMEDANSAVRRAQAAAKCVNGRVNLGVDAGQQIFVRNRWPLADAIRITEALGELDVLFFEDPYLISDLEAYRKLRALKRAPIAGGEMFNDPADFERYCSAGAFDISQPDASVLPGPAASLAACRAADLHGLKTIFHGWAGPVAQLQNIHAALASSGGDTVEFCPLLHPLLSDGLRPVWNFAQGRLSAPESPGMGAASIEVLSEVYPFRGISNLVA